MRPVKLWGFDLSTRMDGEVSDPVYVTVWDELIRVEEIVLRGVELLVRDHLRVYLKEEVKEMDTYDIPPLELIQRIKDRVINSANVQVWEQLRDGVFTEVRFQVRDPNTVVQEVWSMCWQWILALDPESHLNSPSFDGPTT